MAEETEYTGGGYASSGWHETFPPHGAETAAGEPRTRRTAGSTWPDRADRADLADLADLNVGADDDEAPGGSFREQIQDLTQQARKETVRLATDAREQVEALVHRRQELVADRLAGVAAALRDARRRLEREAARSTPSIGGSAGSGVGARGASARPLVAGVDDLAFEAGTAAGGYPPLATAPPALDAATRGLCELAERAAQQVDRASRYLRRSELRDLVRDVEDLARRRPAAFVGGSFATGLLLARFFKSSGERRLPEKLAGR
jgi:hypothetical protein